MTKVVVLGDIHGNARALRAALDQARAGAMDHLVFIGDLLTYGHDVTETLDLVRDAQERHGAVLLAGNHDQMYFDIAAGKTDYFAKLPDWIRESVEHTLSRFDVATFAARFTWSKEWVAERILVSHANPFGYGNWAYLEGAPREEEAIRLLASRALGVGVFGHTHRARWRGQEIELGSRLVAPRSEVLIANAGAVGQPRDGRARSLILRLEVDAEETRATFEPVDYDVAAHVDGLRRSGLTAATVDRLASYFVPRER